MAKGLIQHIAEDFRNKGSRVFLIENNDRFLFRSDVILELKKYGIEVNFGTKIEQRIRFETREKEEVLFLLSTNNSDYLEDIKTNSFSIEFNLSHYLRGFHIPTILQLELDRLDQLLGHDQLIDLNRHETIKFIKNIHVEDIKNEVPSFDLKDFTSELENLLNEDEINWYVVTKLISDGLLKTIGTSDFEKLFTLVNSANLYFQRELEINYQQTKNSSAIKKPKIVSKILDFLAFNYTDQKVALIVIDGLSFWQYELLNKRLPTNKEEGLIYSWIPSITQLSRQAIFRGGNPQTGYRQGPVNEDKLWFNFWKSKGLKKHEVSYQHEKVDLSNLNSISKLAIVFKDLDDKMHGSTDYIDLLTLTKNWVERSRIEQIINELIEKGFSVFLTTDHGNLQSKGWRGLNGREKLGANVSGSRSERHIEYSEKWLKEEFLGNNPDIMDSVVIEEQAIYFKNDLSFSNKEVLVTHGGAHLLEVLIPFVQINHGV
jgi:hypothetical protein